MKIIRLLFLVLLLSVVVGCDVSSHVDKAKEQIDKVADRATNALVKIQAGDLSDLDGFRLQIRSFRASLATNDFPRAKQCANQIDKLLKTEIVAQSIEFLRIESTEGAEKAKEAVTNYMAKNDLGEAETKACREVLTYFANMDGMQRIDLVSAVIYIACEREMSHGAAIPTAFAHVLMEELFLGGVTTNYPAPLKVK